MTFATFNSFKEYASVFFSIFTVLCNHHHYLIPKHFHHPKKAAPRLLRSCPPSPDPAAPPLAATRPLRSTSPRICHVCEISTTRPSASGSPHSASHCRGSRVSRGQGGTPFLAEDQSATWRPRSADEQLGHSQACPPYSPRARAPESKDGRPQAPRFQAPSALQRQGAHVLPGRAGGVPRAPCVRRNPGRGGQGMRG